MQSPFILNIANDPGVEKVKSWLDFNNFEYHTQSFWDDQEKQFSINVNVQEHIIVCNNSVFQNYLKQAKSINELLHFFSKGNQLWVLGMDLALIATIDSEYNRRLHELDSLMADNLLLMFLDAQPTANCRVLNFQKIRLSQLKYNFAMNYEMRVQAANQDKVNAKHDFLLTMLKKSRREHRELLWEKLLARPRLCNRGLISYRAKAEEQWLGKAKTREIPSMDLYLDCFFEVVPETCHENLHFFTEKSLKPIMSKTPFISVSTSGYLRYLQSLGFKTFGSLIDETYDSVIDLNERVDQTVSLLDDIVTSGSRDLYHASKDILDHNFDKFSEITGKWQHSFDQTMWSEFEAFMSK